VQIEKLLSSLLIAINKLQAIQTTVSAIIYIIDNSQEQTPLLLFVEKQQELLGGDNIEFRYIGGHGNVGYGAAQNKAIKAIDSDLHLILNPDVTVESEALVEGVKVFADNRSVVMLSPRAENNFGEKQYLCKRSPTVLTLLIRGFLPKFLQESFKKRLDNYEMRDLSENGLTEGIPFISGCFMLSDTRALRDIGGFDERYFLYFEDFDLCLRMKNHGSLVYSPNVQITHAGGEASKKGFSHIWYFTKSGIRFFNRHGWRYW
jgi:hypothetical protein